MKRCRGSPDRTMVGHGAPRSRLPCWPMVVARRASASHRHPQPRHAGRRPLPCRLLHALGAGVVSPPPAQPAVPRTSNAPVAVVDSDANAQDLRRVYDDDSGSADPRRRRMAARAFAACVPLFVPSAGETPSPEPMIQALPAAGAGRAGAGLPDALRALQPLPGRAAGSNSGDARAAAARCAVAGARACGPGRRCSPAAGTRSSPWWRKP